MNVIKPENRLRIIWEVFILAVTIAVFIEIPLSVVFSSSSQGKILIIEFLISFIYIIDIIIQLNTALVIKMDVITDRHRLASIYLKKWFWLDIAAAFPFWIILHVLSLPFSAAVLGFFRLFRIFKIFRLIQTLGRLKRLSFVNPNIMRMILLIFWIILIAHFVACGWIILEGVSPDEGDSMQYLKAFYWTITTLTTIGYGDITPSAKYQIIYTIFVEIIGAGLYGFIIGNIANLIANIDIARAQHRSKLEKINTFMQYRNIPHSLQKRVDDYYNYLWESRRGYDESSVLQDLPGSLKTSVSIFLNKDMIEKVPLFKGADDALIREIILQLEPVVYTPDDYIVYEGDIGYDMFFISKGSVDVMSGDESIVYATLSAGQFFGEIALLLSMPRTATVKAREYCDVYRLEKEIFDRVIERYPDFAENIRKLAENRRKELNKK